MTQIVVWLNNVANLLGAILLAPIRFLPGWLSATLVAAVTGVIMLVIFKYTSNQRAIKRVRDDIKANLLALKLFKESAGVILRCQALVFWGALRLMALSLVPMLVMIVPVLLILGQLALWYQARPLHVGEEALVTLRLNGTDKSEMPAVELRPGEAAESVSGPVRVSSQRAVYWKLKALKAGAQHLTFLVGDELVTKDLAVGQGFMPVSRRRPGWSWTDVLLYPGEPPFPANGPVHSIDVEYPKRLSWTSGTDSWLIFWFVASMAAAFAIRPWLDVNI